MYRRVEQDERGEKDGALKKKNGNEENIKNQKYKIYYPFSRPVYDISFRSWLHGRQPYRNSVLCFRLAIAAQASSCTVNKLVFYKYENPFCLLYIMIII